MNLYNYPGNSGQYMYIYNPQLLPNRMSPMGFINTQNLYRNGVYYLQDGNNNFYKRQISPNNLTFYRYKQPNTQNNLTNYNNKQHINANNQNMTNQGLYQDVRKLNSVVRNGKLIYNIDVNNDMQGIIQQKYKYPNNNREKFFNNYNNVNQSNNPINTNDNDNNTNQNRFIPLNQLDTSLNESYQLNYELINNNNKVPIIYNNKIPDSIIIENTQIKQNLDTTNSSINDDFTLSLIKSVETKFGNESKVQSILPQVAPTETNRNIHKDGKMPLKEEENPITLSQFIPTETLKSVYKDGKMPLKEEKNPNTLSQFIPTETLKSVYKDGKNPIKEKNKENTLSQFIPTETLNSVYKEENNKLKEDENQNKLSQLNPTETLKSTYKEGKNKLKKDEKENILSHKNEKKSVKENKKSNKH